VAAAFQLLQPGLQIAALLLGEAGPDIPEVDQVTGVRVMGT
jgi:hypothetical protein